MDLRAVDLREQLIAASLDELRGAIHGPCLLQLLNAATLGELLLRRRLSLGREVRVVDSSPTGDHALDAALATVVAGAPRPLSSWVRTLHDSPRIPRDTVLVGLVQGGVLSLDEAMQMGLVSFGSNWARIGELLREMETAVRAALHSSARPSERTCLLIALLDGGRIMERLLGRAEAGSTHVRACAIVEANPIACNMRQALAESVGMLRVGATKGRPLAAVAR